MTDDKGRYLRVYFDRLERDAPEVWYDPTCLSTYVRLLSLSEKAWPAMPTMPRAVRRADLVMLKAAEMIEDLPNDRFVLRGWLKERTKRAETARANVGKRADRTTVVTTVDTVVPTTVLPVRAPASFSSSVEDITGEGPGEPNAWDAFQRRTGEVPGPKIRGWLDELADAHSETRLVSMLDLTPMAGQKVPDYLRTVRDKLRSEDMAAERAERDAEKAAVKSKRAPLRVVEAPPDVTPEEAQRLAAEYTANEKAARA